MCRFSLRIGFVLPLDLRHASRSDEFPYAIALLKRAGIDAPTTGAHQFRHGLASEMLRGGASLGEIGEVLGHRHLQTTAVYAKVDLDP
jgi:site-specific recombinase XerD